MRVLVVEDDELLAESLTRGLTAEGYAVDVARDGIDGLHLATEFGYDVVVLDILLPGLNGYRVCTRLRETGVTVPILMLTAKDGEWDEAEGLDGGADDYLVKPFHYAVLLARIRALLRRGPSRTRPVLRHGDLHLDPATHRCWRAGRDIDLTPREFATARRTSSPPGSRSPRRWSTVRSCWATRRSYAVWSPTSWTTRCGMPPAASPSPCRCRPAKPW